MSLETSFCLSFTTFPPTHSHTLLLMSFPTSVARSMLVKIMRSEGAYYCDGILCWSLGSNLEREIIVYPPVGGCSPC